jgi:hypothetical protein
VDEETSKIAKIFPTNMSPSAASKQAVTWEPRRFPDAPPPAGSVMGPDQHKGEGGHDKAEN